MGAHGGPNMTEEGVVFYYDTGNGKSYKGKPATNIATTISTRGGDVIADPTDLPPIPTSIAPAVYCSSKIVESTNSWQSLFQYAPSFSLAAGERLIVTIWVYIPVGKTNNRFNINCTINGNNTGIIQAPSHDIPTGEWVKLLGSYTNTSGAAVSCNDARLETYTAAEWTGNITCWAANFMVEKGSDIPSAYRGSPATALGATRSVTEGLLDFTENITIDLANVSFSSDAQIDFDGSNDHASLGNPTILRDLTAGSIEAVYRRDASTGTYQMIFTDAGSDLEITYLGNVLQFYIGNSGLSYAHAVTGQYFHVVGSWNSGSKKLYLNGVEVATGTNTGIDTGNRDRYVGGRGTSFPFNGKIDTVKVYNKGLTAEEVKNNFNGIRSRFGI